MALPDNELQVKVKALEKVVERVYKTEMPSREDLRYFNSFPQIHQEISALAKTVQCVLEHFGHLARKVNLAPDWGDVEASSAWLTDLLDDTLETVGKSMDAYRAGLKARKEGTELVTTEAGNLPSFRASAGSSITRVGIVPRHLPTLPRPQEFFPVPVNNDSKVPFAHHACYVSAKLKPQQPVPASLVLPPGIHPLSSTLDNIVYNSWQMVPGEPQPPKAIENTPCHVVDTPGKLDAVVSKLQGVRHIAVDLEAHAYRSYQGFTCLMQLSTREDDFIIDTLLLRSELGPALGPIMANPACVKVLHGAEHDILWLQRDFNIYTANMFDTGQAARVLGYPSCGLAYLLKKWCRVDADKRYQLADWRLRPLTQDMLHYARCDTHYLLYIYDCMLTELIDADKDHPADIPAGTPEFRRPTGRLVQVLERSRQLCLQLYDKPGFRDVEYQDVLCRWQLHLNRQQQGVFAALLQYRDQLAREVDESTAYVMTRAQLVLCSTKMPRSERDLKQLLGHSMSPVLMKRAAEVVALIERSQEDGPPALLLSSVSSGAPEHPSIPCEDLAIEETGSKEIMETLVEQCTTVQEMAQEPCDSSTVVAGQRGSLSATSPEAEAPWNEKGLKEAAVREGKSGSEEAVHRPHLECLEGDDINRAVMEGKAALFGRRRIEMLRRATGDTLEQNDRAGSDSRENWKAPEKEGEDLRTVDLARGYQPREAAEKEEEGEMQGDSVITLTNWCEAQQVETPFIDATQDNTVVDGRVKQLSGRTAPAVPCQWHLNESSTLKKRSRDGGGGLAGLLKKTKVINRVERMQQVAGRLGFPWLSTPEAPLAKAVCVDKDGRGVGKVVTAVDIRSSSEKLKEENRAAAVGAKCTREGENGMRNLTTGAIHGATDSRGKDSTRNGIVRVSDAHEGLVLSSTNSKGNNSLMAPAPQRNKCPMAENGIGIHSTRSKGNSVLGAEGPHTKAVCADTWLPVRLDWHGFGKDQAVCTLPQMDGDPASKVVTFECSTGRGTVHRVGTNLGESQESNHVYGSGKGRSGGSWGPRQGTVGVLDPFAESADLQV